MLMYNVLRHRDNYSKILGSLWQNYRDDLVLTDTDVVADFNFNNNNDKNSVSLELKQIITCKTSDDGT